MKKANVLLPLTSMGLSILGLFMLQMVNSSWSNDELSGIVGLPSAGLGIGILCIINQKSGMIISVVGIVLGIVGLLLGFKIIFY